MKIFKLYYHSQFIFTGLVFGLLVSSSSCTTSPEDKFCERTNSYALDNNICLSFDDNGEFDAIRGDVVQITQSTFESVNDLMPIDDIQILITVNPQYIIPELSLGGFNPSKNEVIVSIDYNSEFSDQSLEENLSTILAHEIHHAIRRRSVGYGSTLFEAMVTEGLADHFAVEVTQLDPPIWSIYLNKEELERMLNESRSQWDNNPYNHNLWFFGNNADIPRWAGYSMGFELVDRYLKANPNRKPSDLYDKKASSFIPE